MWHRRRAHACLRSDPLPGKTHDAKAIDDTGLSEILHYDNSIGDKGFIGKGPTTPFRTPAGGELLDWPKEFNTAITRIRYVIERAIANFRPGDACSPTTADLSLIHI